MYVYTDFPRRKSVYMYMAFLILNMMEGNEDGRKANQYPDRRQRI
ncbi:hypothetical protein CHCC20441_1697 [Bacillus licheniformis]|uniref:Uncharacterized protein n=1 Tax=Bacillus licheniformis TaxID=1402 RepID=A0A8B5Y8S9_BACLI|nr:hypothetical protein MUY_002840 [Bacillus licheniformis WX-02]KYC69206.1 hypothetical protein B4092_2930 [Bacillus licheniformis]KYC80999.1 hypothetical protein B4091_3018 [Bacillus licheniformis]KYC96425.1 hypothetical protein B4164_2870 [Bacillus licheniformis]OLF91992.1 hypothetical protein B4094_2769 [Bacillus licheniformis]